MIDWAEGVNKQIKRGSNWELPSGVILEETRSGKRKSRPAEQLLPKPFSVDMIFSYNEYLIFEAWFTTKLRNGALTFKFPDVITGLVDREYRIIGNPSFDNPSGKLIKCSMEWEEVR